ncbi:hypothetical protein [Ensifer sp. BR816]|uniref:hypothetical protein n=1 Tax=Rhizobium sp. (strain BR816) TaxID=1057002 RepID=UPI000368D43D|nr:hypothetical protein [Ensifer sp. BR816]
MIKRLLSTLLKRFERRYDYNAAYLRELIGADPRGGVLLMLATQYLARDFGLTPDVYFAAKLRSTMRADCGPCLDLALKLADENGANRRVMAAALDHGNAPADAALAIAFADAVLDNAPGLAEIAEAVRKRFGERGRAGLATAVVAGQFYPLLKRGLGHAAICSPVKRDFLASVEEERYGHEEEAEGWRHS